MLASALCLAYKFCRLPEQRKTMRSVVALLICCFALTARAADLKDFGCLTGGKVLRPSASLCLPGKSLLLKYEPKSRTVSIAVNGHKSQLERIKSNYGPDLIGMEEYIRFLPLTLQPYLSRNIILFNSVLRSNGGEGMGQCGSGYEMYLNAVNIGRTNVKVLSKVRIGSCHQSMFPDRVEEGATDFSAYSIQDGRLRIRFFNYPDMEGSRTGFLSENLRQLEFNKDSQ
jgi:hypothetical protein